jgi:glycerophosphoryl diester phosphodiesterase
MNVTASPAPALTLLARRSPLVIGHRGACARAPENTLPSFKLALDAGADLVELDYQHSADGVPIVVHDETLDRTTDACRRWGGRRIAVRDKTVAEIQALDAGGWFADKFAGAKVPLLTEALDFICGSGGVTLIERKAGDAATLAKILRERELVNKVVVISFDWQFLRELHELEPFQVLGALGPPESLPDGRTPSRGRKGLSATWLDALVKTGARVVVWNRGVLGAAVKLAHLSGWRVWVYTVDSPTEAHRLVGLGVDGIISNDPALIRHNLTNL